MFSKSAQDAGENVDHCIIDVIKLAEYCRYDELKNDLIRDRLVGGV